MDEHLSPLLTEVPDSIKYDVQSNGAPPMRHEFIEALSGALFALALIALERLLPFPEPYNILIACIVGAISFTVIFVLCWRFRHSRWLRSRIDEMHYFEGDWLEEWLDGRGPRYSISSIRFDDKVKQYILVGNSYDKDGNWMARWTSHHLLYERMFCRLVYVSDGYQKNGKTVFGASCLYMDTERAQEGKGFFIDDSSGHLAHFDFTFKRLLDPAKPWQANPQHWIALHHRTQNS